MLSSSLNQEDTQIPSYDRKPKSKEERNTHKEHTKMMLLSQKVHRYLKQILSISPPEPTLKTIQTLLRTDPLKRSLEEIAQIKCYLENKTNIHQKFKKDEIASTNHDKILIIFSAFTTFKSVVNGTKLYDLNDQSKYLYIILRGSVTLYKPKDFRYEFNGYEYYMTLCRMMSNEEVALVKMTIDANKHFFNIDFNDFNILNKVLLKLRYDRIEHKSEVNRIFLLKCNIDPADYGIDFDKMSRIAIDDKIHSIFRNLNHELENKYTFLVNDYIVKRVSIYKYEECKVCLSNEYFGDSDNGLYTHKAVSEDSTDLIVLNYHIYNEYANSEKRKSKQKELTFVYDQFFFNTIVKRKFDREYFQMFVKEKLKKNDILFKENEKVKYIYFIQEGNIEITINKSILELHALIQLLNKICKEEYNLKKLFLYTDSNDNNFKSDYPNNLNLTNFMNKNLEKIQELKVKIKSRVFIYRYKEMLCLESLYYGMNNLFTAKVISEDCSILKISVEDLFILFSHEDKKTYKEFISECRKKLDVIKDRLGVINKINFDVIGKKMELPVFNSIYDHVVGNINSNNITDTNSDNTNTKTNLNNLNSNRDEILYDENGEELKANIIKRKSLYVNKEQLKLSMQKSKNAYSLYNNNSSILKTITLKASSHCVNSSIKTTKKRSQIQLLQTDNNNSILSSNSNLDSMNYKLNSNLNTINVTSTHINSLFPPLTRNTITLKSQFNNSSLFKKPSLAQNYKKTKLTKFEKPKTFEDRFYKKAITGLQSTKKEFITGYSTIANSRNENISLYDDNDLMNTITSKDSNNNYNIDNDNNFNFDTPYATKYNDDNEFVVNNLFRGSNNFTSRKKCESNGLPVNNVTFAKIKKYSNFDGDFYFSEYDVKKRQRSYRKKHLEVNKGSYNNEEGDLMGGNRRWVLNKEAFVKSFKFNCGKMYKKDKIRSDKIVQNVEYKKLIRSKLDKI